MAESLRSDMRGLSPKALACVRASLLVCAAAIVLKPDAAHADPSDLPPEVGYNYGAIETPRVAAMNGALRAFANPTDSLFINPAGMPVTRVYHLGALAQVWPEASRQSYGAVIVDSVVSSARLAGGLGGTWTQQDPDGIDRTSTDLRFALAYPFSDQFFVGLGMRYLWLEQNGYGPLGRSIVSGGLDDENIVRGITFDAGVTVRPSPEFALAVVGTNLNNPDTSFQPTVLGGGVGFGTDVFTVEADVESDFTTWGSTTLRGMGGLEVLAGDFFPIRAGYRYDDGAKSHSISGGLGYIDRTFAAELGLRRVVSGDAVTAVVIGFTYHLEATQLTPSPGTGF